MPASLTMELCTIITLPILHGGSALSSIDESKPPPSFLTPKTEPLRNGASTGFLGLGEPVPGRSYGHGLFVVPSLRGFLNSSDEGEI